MDRIRKALARVFGWRVRGRRCPEARPVPSARSWHDALPPLVREATPAATVAPVQPREPVALMTGGPAETLTISGPLVRRYVLAHEEEQRERDLRRSGILVLPGTARCRARCLRGGERSHDARDDLP